MLTPTLVVVVVGLLLWPSRVVGQRLTALLPSASRCRGNVRLRDRRVAAALVVSVVVGFVLTAGVLVTGACGLLASAFLLHRRSRVRARAVVEDLDQVASALHGMVAELRAGSHPVTAVDTVAGEAPSGLAERLRTLAASAKLHGIPDIDAHAGSAARTSAHLERVVARVATAWSLAVRHGVPLADVLGAVHRDVESTARAARQLDARLAGARAGAAVLAVLPAAGLVLGEAMGAAPVGVLVGTPGGAAVFVVGAGLLLAGVAWTSWLTGRVLP